MPIGRNPAFQPIMAAVDLIARDNMRMQAEGRAESREQQLWERNIGREDMLFEKSLELQGQERQRTGAQQEYDDITKWLGEYDKAVTGGLIQPEVETLKMVVNRKNKLMEETPGLISRQPLPGIPEKDADKDKLFTLSKLAQSVFNYSSDEKFTKQEKTDMEYKARQFMQQKEGAKGGSGAGKEPKTPLQEAIEKVTKQHAQMQKNVEMGLKVEGDTERLGVPEEASTYYLRDTAEMVNRMKTETDSTALDSLINRAMKYPDPTVFSREAESADKDTELDDILELLKKIK